MELCWQGSVSAFYMLSRLVIAFLPSSKCLLISWLQSPSAVILEPKKVKSVTVSIVSPSICYEVMGPDAMIFVFFECWDLSQLFHSPLSLSSSGSLVPLHYLHYSTLNSFREPWISAAVAAQGSISSEADGKYHCCYYCLVIGKCSWQVLICSWPQY